MTPHARHRPQHASLLLHGIVAGTCVFSTGKAVKSIALVQERDHHGADAASAATSAPQAELGHIFVSDQRLWSSLLQEHVEVRKSAGSGMSLAVLWGCVVAISFALAASILYLCSAVRAQRAYEAKSSPARGMPSGAADGRSMRSMSSLRSCSDACSERRWTRAACPRRRCRPAPAPAWGCPACRCATCWWCRTARGSPASSRTRCGAG
ncbi:unnamed protein product, partial [Prorocentrum cordatum]